MSNQVLIVIPARMASTRFPNKPLAPILGTSMIERVYKIAKACTLGTDVVIATDDSAIANAIPHANVVMTSSSCKTGTDRVAETLSLLKKDYDVVFSLQGDAVLTPPWVIDDIIKAMLQDTSIQIATPAVELKDKAKEDFIALKKTGSSSGTSVVFDKKHKALYFSKTLIPFARNSYDDTPIYRHIGLYGYRPKTLSLLTQLSQTTLEKSESLEQLRALENGIPIHVVEVDYHGRTHGSVDNKSDVDIVEKIIKSEGELVA